MRRATCSTSGSPEPAWHGAEAFGYSMDPEEARQKTALFRAALGLSGPPAIPAVQRISDLPMVRVDYGFIVALAMAAMTVVLALVYGLVVPRATSAAR